MKPDPHLSKSQAQQIHARRQFRRRRNIDFTSELHHQVVEMISTHDARARFLEKQSNRVSVWEVPVSGISCRVVYDRKRRNIVTVLPERWNADYVQRWWEN